MRQGQRGLAVKHHASTGRRPDQVSSLPQICFVNLGISKFTSSLPLFICFVYLAFSGFMKGVMFLGA